VKSLKDAGILQMEHDEDGRRRFVVNTDLGEDFSIHHALSLYLLDTLKLIAPSEPGYELHVLTLVESMLENPEVVLMRQLDKLKRDLVNELKAKGVEYDQRMEELEKLEYPKPNRDFIYDTFNAFAAKHPWVKAENIRPKSIAREMVEQYMSFGEYVKEYGLERSEGLLLRYLSDVYKTLVQTVPKWAKTDDVEELATFFGAIVRQVDASLLDEWERMKNVAERIELPRAREDLEPEGSKDITKDKKAFMVLVRNEIFRFLRAVARGDYPEAARTVMAEGASEIGEAARLEAETKAYFAEHQGIRTDPAARSPKLLDVEETDSVWRIRQAILDPEGDEDWFFEGTIDLARSRDAARPIMAIERFGR
jgi:hypothetical protein